MKKSGIILTGSFLILALGCSSNEKKLDEALQATPPVKNAKEIQSEAAERIENSPDMTSEQKQKLTDLRKSVRREMNQLQEESLKLRALLMEAVLGDDYQDAKVETIKQRLRKVENQKLAATFRSVDRANQILGRASAIEHRRELMYDMMIRPADGMY